ncbi:MAG: hypothetical protein CR986_01030 [Ignavibacteriae bacterium]|nr:MAG: hypothetical protein CR986_01030 [Ignavibacteriota bacterium]
MINFTDFNIIQIINHLGTFAFALSGIRLSSHKNFDWFGAYVVGLITAIGGGTFRDILLDITPFWMESYSYIIITGIALVLFLLFNKPLLNLNKTLFIFDTIGLGLFVVVGIEKTLETGFPFSVAIIMGTITGSLGGVIRDILINETPLIFRKDIYALACIAGGISYLLCYELNLSLNLTQIIASLTVIVIRFVAVKYKIQVPNINFNNNL